MDASLGTLGRHGGTEDAIDALPAEIREQLSAELLQLQERFHRDAAPFLGPELSDKLRNREPLIIEFHQGGGGIAVYGHARGF
jgi:hypothetical protein